MIYTPFTKKGHSKKLTRPFKGPYEVIKTSSTNLQIRKNKNADPIVVHANRCKLAEDRDELEMEEKETILEPQTVQTQQKKTMKLRRTKRLDILYVPEGI